MKINLKKFALLPYKFDRIFIKFDVARSFPTWTGGDIEGGDESLPYPDHFIADYPRTKAEAERTVLAAQSDQLNVVALRPHLIWGPGDRHLIPRLLDRAQRGRLRHIAPHKLVDSVYIEDAARAHWNAFDLS